MKHLLVKTTRDTMTKYSVTRTSAGYEYEINSWGEQSQVNSPVIGAKGCDVIGQYPSLTMNTEVFFSQCLLSIIKPVHLVFLDEGSIRNQPVGFAVTTVSFQSLRLMRSLSFISALAPWQPTASRELYSHIVKFFFFLFFSFNVTFPIWISDASLCGSTHNDLCFSSALLFQHKKPGGKSQREAKRAKSIIYSI